MQTSPSLRAKRGNPEADAAQFGLPRRYAPRNDGFPRAFAPSRETNFLFTSREGAKAHRKAWFVVLVGSLLTACSVDMPAKDVSQRPDTQLIARSEMTAKDPVLKCVEGSDSETKVCIAKLLAAEEKRMNDNLALVKDQGAVDFKTFSEGQVFWLSYASKHCQVSEANSVESLRNSCVVNKMSERADEIGGFVID